MLLLAIILLAALGEATRRSADAWKQHSSRLAADGRAHAATTAEVWRTRLDASLSRWRTRSRLDAISVERGPALQALGDAVWRGDKAAEKQARQRLVELEQEGKRIEDELAERLAGADERIRRARLPVQDTIMVTPNEPKSSVSAAGRGQPAPAGGGPGAIPASRRGDAAGPRARPGPDRERVTGAGRLRRPWSASTMPSRSRSSLRRSGRQRREPGRTTAAGSRAGCSRTCSRSPRPCSSPRSGSGCCFSPSHHRAADRLHYLYGTLSLLAVLAPWMYAPAERRGRLAWFTGATLVAGALAVRAYLTAT